MLAKDIWVRRFPGGPGSEVSAYAKGATVRFRRQRPICSPVRLETQLAYDAIMWSITCVENPDAVPPKSIVWSLERRCGARTLTRFGLLPAHGQAVIRGGSCQNAAGIGHQRGEPAADTDGTQIRSAPMRGEGDAK
jgi:hypothetical protein